MPKRGNELKLEEKVESKDISKSFPKSLKDLLNDELVNQIIELKKQGWTWEQIAKWFNERMGTDYSKSAIRKAVKAYLKERGILIPDLESVQVGASERKEDTASSKLQEGEGGEGESAGEGELSPASAFEESKTIIGYAKGPYMMFKVGKPGILVIPKKLVADEILGKIVEYSKKAKGSLVLELVRKEYESGNVKFINMSNPEGQMIVPVNPTNPELQKVEAEVIKKLTDKALSESDLDKSLEKVEKIAKIVKEIAEVSKGSNVDALTIKEAIKEAVKEVLNHNNNRFNDVITVKLPDGREITGSKEFVILMQMMEMQNQRFENTINNIVQQFQRFIDAVTAKLEKLEDRLSRLEENKTLNNTDPKYRLLALKYEREIALAELEKEITKLEREKLKKRKKEKEEMLKTLLKLLEGEETKKEIEKLIGKPSKEICEKCKEEEVKESETRYETKSESKSSSSQSINVVGVPGVEYG